MRGANYLASRISASANSFPDKFANGVSWQSDDYGHKHRDGNG
jgi:hypothetical protein